MLTKFKNSFFHGETFSIYFRIFEWIAMESFLNRVSAVYKQVGIGFKINTRQTQRVEVTLIQCCFNVTTLKQR